MLFVPGNHDYHTVTGRSKAELDGKLKLLEEQFAPILRVMNRDKLDFPNGLRVRYFVCLIA